MARANLLLAIKPSKKKIILTKPFSVNRYFVAKTFVLTIQTVIVKYKPVSYTHLDVYKRQVHISTILERN